MGDETQDLDGTDEEGDEHRQSGDGQVVVDLPDRFGKGPVVGEVHEAPVEGVEEAHAGGKENWQGEHGVERKATHHGRSGQDEQGDFAGSVESETEEGAEGIHLPWCVDPPGVAAEESIHQSAAVELALELRVVVLPLSHFPGDPDDGDQHEEIEQADEVEKGPRDRRTNDPGPFVKCRGVVSHGSVKGTDPEVQHQREEEDDRRVPEREEVSDAERPLAVLDQLARRIVYRRDVVGVEGVAHAERVGEDPCPEAEDFGLVDVVVPARRGGQQSPTQDVQPEDAEGHRADAGPLPRREAVTDPRQSRPWVSHPSQISSAAAPPGSLRKMRAARNSVCYAVWTALSLPCRRRLPAVGSRRGGDVSRQCRRYAGADVGGDNESFEGPRPVARPLHSILGSY